MLWRGAPGWRRAIQLGGVILFGLCLSLHLGVTLRWALDGNRPPPHVEPRGYRNVLGDLEPRLRLTDREIPGLPYAVTIDAQGFRGSRAVGPHRAPGSLRVLCLGDSYTYGVGVDDAAAYPALLERFLADRLPGRPVEVVNAGVPFYDIFDEWTYYVDKGARLAPDVVVLQFYINDLEAMAGSFFRQDLLRRQGGDYNVFEQALGREAVDRWWNAWLDGQVPGLVRFVRAGLPAGPSRAATGPLAAFHLEATPAEQALLRDRRRLLTAPMDAAAARFWANYRRALLRLRDAVRAGGSKLLFVITPDPAQVVEDLNQPAAALVPFCRANGIPVLDLTRPLRAMADGHAERYYLLPLNAHLNAAGNTILAKAVADALRVSERDGRLAVTVRPRQPAFGYEQPLRTRLRFDSRGVTAGPDDPLGVTVVQSDNLRPWSVDIGGQNRISGVMPDVARAPEATLLLRLEAGKPLAQVSLTLFYKFAPPVNGSLLVSWARQEQGPYTNAFFLSDADATGPEGYEHNRLAEIDLRDAPARRLYLRLRLRNEARIFGESLSPPWRRFEIVGYPVGEAAEAAQPRSHK